MKQIKSLKQINLVDEYLDPADVRFFCTAWAPNGTSDLIIVDQDSQVIGYIPDLLFGPPLDPDRNGESVGGRFFDFYGESVGMVEGESLDEYLANPSSDVPEVFPLLWPDVLNYLAESPAKSRFDALRELVATVKGVING